MKVLFNFSASRSLLYLTRYDSTGAAAIKFEFDINEKAKPNNAILSPVDIPSTAIPALHVVFVVLHYDPHGPHCAQK